MNYGNRHPYKITVEELSKDQYYKLVESKYFCMLPWIHMHAFPDGRAYPCCLSDYFHPVGNLRDNTMREVWNSEKYKTIRLNMLNEKPSVECVKCYEQESHGGFSMRNSSNRSFGHNISLVDKTNQDGSLDDFVIRYWDIRFSNLCNFRCRTCGPMFSSQWFGDHVKMYGRVPDALGRPMKVIEYAGRSKTDIEEQMIDHIPYLEQVYFAGGEPLIMQEHYTLLEKLIDLGKTDIVIQYNTNFSELRFKDKHVFDYWKHFKNVSVGASLDAMGSRAELMRKGTDWKQTVSNRERMLKEVPHVDFYVSSTVSNMNILHVMDFHKHWTDLGLVKAKDWNVNLLQSPDWYRADVLPEDFKHNTVIPKLEEHISWLEPQDSLSRATIGYKSLKSFILAENREDLLTRFVKEVSVLDNARSEKFWEIFNELGVIYEKYR